MSYTPVTTTVPALDKVIKILNFISEHPGRNFSQIQEALELPRSSTSSLLNAMHAHNLIRKEKNQFYLGLKLITLGNTSLEQRDITRVAKPVLTNLRDQTQLTCHLGVLQDLTAIYLVKVESNYTVSINTWIGKNLSLHSSGVGKALCAWLDEDELMKLFPYENLEVFTANTISTRTQLFHELECIKSRGLSYDNGEDADEVSCIAAPIFDMNGKVLAAISMSGVGNQLPDEKREQFSALLLQSAEQIHNAIYS